MSDTSTQRCPFKIDTTLDEGIPCETTSCAAWDDDSGECLLIRAALRLVGGADFKNKSEMGL